MITMIIRPQAGAVSGFRVLTDLVRRVTPNCLAAANMIPQPHQLPLGSPLRPNPRTQPQ